MVKFTPDLKTFLELAKTKSVVSVKTDLCSDMLTPVSVYKKLVAHDEGFLLESVDHRGSFSRFSIIGFNPAAKIILKNGQIESLGNLDLSEFNDNNKILAFLDNLLANFKTESDESDLPLSSGVVGYIGYDVIREVERLPMIPVDDQNLPEAALFLVGTLIVFDHHRQKISVIKNVFSESDDKNDFAGERYTNAIEELNSLIDLIQKPQAPETDLEPDDEADLEVSKTFSDSEFKLAVISAKEYILAGDAFQIVLSQRFDFQVKCDPFEIYRVLRQVNPSPYLYYLKFNEVTVVGASPEPLVKVVDKRVISRPIAGTRPRGRTDLEDKKLAGELLEDPKELSEHIMLVDLARNDVGRIAEFNSMSIDELMTVEKYSHVIHITSQVSGQLKDNLTPIDVIRATLPAGTLSGAPKVRAMEIIDELEKTKRGVYAGIIGYIGFDSKLDMAIAIRTLVIKPDMTASVQAGAGIVIESDPDAENMECMAKAGAILKAVKLANSINKSNL